MIASESYNILHIRKSEGEIRHYIQSEDTIKIAQYLGQIVTIKIDTDKRHDHTRYHSAGHLIAHVTEMLYPLLKAVKGHHFPNESFIEFMGKLEGEDNVITRLQEKINDMVQGDFPTEFQFVSLEQAHEIVKELPYIVPKDEMYRMFKIADYAPVPCGGTHVKSLAELGSVHLVKIKTKGDSTKIYYQV